MIMRTQHVTSVTENEDGFTKSLYTLEAHTVLVVAWIFTTTLARFRPCLLYRIEAVELGTLVK